MQLKWLSVMQDGFPREDERLLLKLNKEIMIWQSIEVGSYGKCLVCESMHWHYWERPRNLDTVTHYVYLDDVLKLIKD